MVSHEPLHMQAYNYIKDRILSNDFKDNVIYSQTQVANEAGVSRTPMRDALQRLEQEGYIEILPSKGFRLKMITEENIIKCSQIRNALEGYCAYLIAQNHTSEKAVHTISLLENLLQKQYSVFEINYDVKRFSKLDVQFHLEIVRFSENAEMISLFSNNLFYIQRLAEQSLSATGRVKDTLDEHYSIYNSIKQGNPLEAYKAIMVHNHNGQCINLLQLKKNE